MLVIMIGIGGWIMGGIEEKTGIIVVGCLYKGTGHPSPDRNGYPATGCGREGLEWEKGWREEYEWIAGLASKKNQSLYRGS
ncbi:hypothetical protein ATE47_14050 [Chryseobacterium sp. IHB B 17019]|nr:hypothetical protein ATE47_14050 [Chryseobacterium sp. IHB B 17019]